MTRASWRAASASWPASHRHFYKYPYVSPPGSAPVDITRSSQTIFRAVVIKRKWTPAVNEFHTPTVVPSGSAELLREKACRRRKAG